MKDLSDIDLVTLTKAARDNAAFEVLVRRHQAPLRAFLRRLTGDAALSDDVAQDTFIKALGAIRSFSGGGSFRSWLYSIAYREFLQDRRKHTARNRLAGALAEEISGPGADPSADLSLDMRQALATLDEKERAALLFCDAVGMSHGEASLAMDAPLGSVKTYVARARQKMRAALSQETPSASSAQPAQAGDIHAPR